MTGIALGRGAGRDVVIGFSQGCATGGHICAVVASKAGRAGHDCMIHVGWPETGVALMTALTRHIGRHVVSLLGHRGHAGKYLAGMASIASADDAGVDHRCTGEVGELARRVAGLASQAGRQVVARFRDWRHADKYLAVMAACAIVEDATVVHHA